SKSPTSQASSRLRSRIVTSKTGRGDRRYLPYAFTEQGVASSSVFLHPFFEDVDPASSCGIISAMSVPILPLNEMSVEEKLQTMEALRQSLSADPAAIESPAWHEEELAERERKIESGEAKFVEWEKAKADIRRRTS